MLKFRKLNDDDNIKKISHWIYSTDVVFFNRLFTNKTNSLEAIKNLITSDYVNPYHRKFVTVAYDDKTGNIRAVALSFKGNEITVRDTFNAFKGTGFTNSRNLMLYEYASVIVTSYLKNNEYYLASLYVDKNFRNRTIGSKLVENVKQKARQSNSSRLLVDIEDDNSSMADFFKRFDFEKSKLSYHKLIGVQYGFSTMVYKIK
ncbi:MAG: GNAT family N-acetyltransferase [Methanosphaera sp.]|nr:GNAT family N-acetyltransferase [Methanosphaera sp.]